MGSQIKTTLLENPTDINININSEPTPINTNVNGDPTPIQSNIIEHATPIVTNLPFRDDAVLSVNGQVGDVKISASIPDFEINHSYKKYDIIFKEGELYTAKDDFVSTSSFVLADWDIIGLDQLQADWNQANTAEKDFIKNKPALKPVATSGSYNDLDNKPTIGNATLTITQNGVSKGTFTANATSDKTIDINADVSWGNILGNINSQTDLKTILDSKAFSEKLIPKVGNNNMYSGNMGTDADFNDYGVAGYFHQISYSNGNTALNRPTGTASAGWLQVITFGEPVITGGTWRYGIQIWNSIVGEIAIRYINTNGTGVFGAGAWRILSNTSLTLSTTDIGEGANLDDGKLYGVYV